MAMDNTHRGRDGIAKALVHAHRLWFIGIGGVHMTGLAFLASARGFSVAGSDRCENEGTRRLREAGIPVFIGHDAANVEEAEGVIYTLAIAQDNPEYCAAREKGIPLFSRADFLGFLMADYPCRIGVAGSHGKSTVTAMLSVILEEDARNPTVLCGAPLAGDAAAFRVGGEETFLFEACEYADSFLSFSPTVAILLNVGLDHVDYFADMGAIARSFGAYASLADAGGRVLCNRDDPVAMAVTAGRPRRVTFGLSGDADYHPLGLSYMGGMASYLFMARGQCLGMIRLAVPGRHNVYNSLAAAAGAHLCGASGGAIRRGLSAFRGAGRRMEYKGLLRGARVFDDYAHHPDEIAATLAAARDMAAGGRVIALFQPHTYTRTAAFFTDYCRVLSAADAVFITEIYAAREKDRMGMSGARLAAGIRGAAYVGDFTAAAAAVTAAVAPGDVVVVMGAGDVARIFRKFSPKHFTLKRK